jgi:hypothetical protein
VELCFKKRKEITKGDVERRRSREKRKENKKKE